MHAHVRSRRGPSPSPSSPQEFDVTHARHPLLRGPGPAVAAARAGGCGSTASATSTRLKLTLRGKRLGLSLAEIKRAARHSTTRRATSRPQICKFLAVLSTAQRPRWSSSARTSRRCCPRSHALGAAVPARLLEKPAVPGDAAHAARRAQRG
ncbi:MAG: hypothetical protein MZW92_05060 [Comamonadaceae bacterium]|nr:hypothetical protein [Comamonadaceae bacterium]